MAKSKASRKYCLDNVKCLPCPVEATSPAQDETVVASQLALQPDSDRNFLKPFNPTIFFVATVVAFFECELLSFFDDKFRRLHQQTNRRTLRTALRLPNTNV